MFSYGPDRSPSFLGFLGAGGPRLALAAFADSRLRHARAVLVRNHARERHLHVAVPAAAQFRAVELNPEKRIFTLTYPGAGSGSGKSPSARTVAAGPLRS